MTCYILFLQRTFCACEGNLLTMLVYLPGSGAWVIRPGIVTPLNLWDVRDSPSCLPRAGWARPLTLLAVFFLSFHLQDNSSYPTKGLRYNDMKGCPKPPSPLKELFLLPPLTGSILNNPHFSGKNTERGKQIFSRWFLQVTYVSCPLFGCIFITTQLWNHP